MRSSIVQTLLIQLGAVFVLAALLIGYLWITSEYDNLAKESTRYREQFLADQKALLSSEVRKIKSFLTSEKARAESQLETQIRQRVTEAHAVASHLYRTHQGRLSDKEIRQRIVEALRPMRFNDGRGYFFITSLDTTEHLFPPNPSFEGHKAQAIFSAKGVEVVDEMIGLVRRQGEGFLRYDWPLPDQPKNEHRKYSYVKLFAPYGWIIGTGDYLSKVEEQVKERIFRAIAEVKYGPRDEGYFFINSYRGDLYVTNGQYFGGKKNIWDVTDVNGKKVVQENARLAQTHPEGGFSEYVWKKPSGVEAAKISFILGMDEWNIFIGTGAYIDTLEQEISNREAQLTNRLRQRIGSALAIFVGALLLIALAAYLIARKLALDFSHFQRAFGRASENRVRIEPERIHFKEFKVLGDHCNRMIDTLNRQTDRLRYQAYHDHLTALPNRVKGMVHLARMVNHAQEEDASVALLYIDVDDFKEINDTLGHSVGDRLLQMISDRLSQAIREEDAVARLGGDEFLIITGLLRHPEDATVIAEKLLQQLQHPFSIEENTFHVSASIGICVYPDDGDDAETLLRNADSAMYQAKRSGKNAYTLYHDRLTREAAARAELLDELRVAIDQGQFELYYQPVLDIPRHRIVGVEALVRWHHPSRGILAPDQFIPLSESSGLITPLGDWVLREACHRFACWQQDGMAPDYISINISARQLQREALPELIVEVLSDTGLSPDALELEITESVVMEITGPVLKALGELKGAGLGLAIDDFGTGYSSLGSLKQLPINKLKIDRSFVRDLETDENDQAIVRAIISMGRSLGLSVVAEGVEVPAQADWLLQEGASLFQGYLYSRPLPEAQLLEFMQRYRTHQSTATEISPS